MAVNYPIKSKGPELSATPEESGDLETNEGTHIDGLPHNRSGFSLHLQERLLSCGNSDALLDNGNRSGRRPSVSSLSVDGVSGRDRDSDDGGYFGIKRVVSAPYPDLSLLVS